MKRPGSLPRRTGLRSRTPIRPVNRVRKKKLYARNFGSYAEIVRALPCTVCDRSPAEPHHAKSRGAGGDRSSLCPLCRPCHALLHLMGRQSFEARFRVDLAAEAAALWEQFGP